MRNHMRALVTLGASIGFGFGAGLALFIGALTLIVRIVQWWVT